LVEGRVVVYVRRSEGETRVGMVCGRRVGGAVIRNRARRVLKEAWRHVGPHVRSGYDVVFVAQPGIRGARMMDLVRDMTRALTAAGVMTG
jgi:ribonuclease P protein component